MNTNEITREFDWDSYHAQRKGRARSKQWIKYCAKLPEIDLLEEVTTMAGGDDYDGGFTHWGQYEYDMCKYILERRIRAMIKERDVQTMIEKTQIDNADFIKNNPLNVWSPTIKDGERVMESPYEYIYVGDKVVGVWRRYRKPTPKELMDLFKP